MLGENQQKMLNFCNKYAGVHSIKKDAITVQVAKSLAKRKLLTFNERYMTIERLPNKWTQ